MIYLTGDRSIPLAYRKAKKYAKLKNVFAPLREPVGFNPSDCRSGTASVSKQHIRFVVIKYMTMKQVANIDEYIVDYPREVQTLLHEMRSIIRKTVPDAEEAIKYGIPTYVWHGNLVHFGGFKNHIGFYPGADGVASFKKELAKYECSKGAIQFPLDKPLPASLIARIVRYRVASTKERMKVKATKNK
jgi:uncharacterized protein YdhG (YjbR/CyaY superfamily)